MTSLSPDSSGWLGPSRSGRLMPPCSVLLQPEELQREPPASCTPRAPRAVRWCCVAWTCSWSASPRGCTYRFTPTFGHHPSAGRAGSLHTLCSCHVWGCRKGSGRLRPLLPPHSVHVWASEHRRWGAASTRVRISCDLRDVPQRQPLCIAELGSRRTHVLWAPSPWRTAGSPGLHRSSSSNPRRPRTALNAAPHRSGSFLTTSRTCCTDRCSASRLSFASVYRTCGPKQFFFPGGPGQPPAWPPLPQRTWQGGRL